MWGRASSVEPGNERPPAGRQGFSQRRRARRRRAIFACFLLLLVLLGIVAYGLRQNDVRISRVEIIDADSSLAEYATNAMRGSYGGIIPRDSIFFFPEERIRAAILSAHPDIIAVSIFRNRFTGILIKVDYRVPIARWCGLSPTPDVEEYCYIFDANGVIFSAVSSTTQTINTFKLYVPLVGDALEPLHTTIMNANKVPTVFDFARQLATFGSPVISVVIHDGEVDNKLASGTRITYVLGREQDAFTALVSARKNLNLANGSVDYVDLRFDGKVYLKKKE